MAHQSIAAMPPPSAMPASAVTSTQFAISVPTAVTLVLKSSMLWTTSATVAHTSSIAAAVISERIQLNSTTKTTHAVTAPIAQSTPCITLPLSIRLHQQSQKASSLLGRTQKLRVPSMQRPRRRPLTSSLYSPSRQRLNLLRLERRLLKFPAKVQSYLSLSLYQNSRLHV